MNNQYSRSTTMSFLRFVFLNLLGIVLSFANLEGQNLVQNFSFESGMNNWSWFTSGSATATCSITTEEKHWSENSILISSSSGYAPDVYGALWQSISGLTIGSTYHIQIWCKGNGVGTQAQIITGSAWQFRKAIPSGTYDWTSVEYNFVADATTEPLIVAVQDQTSSLWIDDVYLTAPQRSCTVSFYAPTQNAVQNSGFEDNFNNWFWWNNSGATGSATIDQNTAHWEDKSAQLSSSSPFQSNVYLALGQTISGLTVGNTYYIALWCKGNGVGTHAQIETGSNWQFRQNIPSGTYDWTLIQYSFVADATTEPILVVVQDPTTSLWVDDVYLTTNPRTDVTSIGIPGTDADVTSAIQSALNTYKFLYFPTGTYRITSPITIPQGAIIWGDGAGSIIDFANTSATSSPFVAVGSDSTYMGDNEITGIQFIGNQSQIAINMAKVSNVLVRHCLTQNMCLFHSYAEKTSYEDISSENDLCNDIHVVFNYLTSSTESSDASTVAGIDLDYTVDSEVYKNNISYFKHGIYWWGGNADYASNGNVTNPRWARRISVIGNIIQNINQGGIWGSMGQNIAVAYNYVNECGDNGLDFEGCVESEGMYNTLQNARMTTFFAATNITFQQNASSMDNPSNSLYRTYNDSGNSENDRSIYLLNNTLICTSGIGFIDNYNGPAYLDIENNTLTNVAVAITGSNGNDTGSNTPFPTIIGNTLTFTEDTADPLVGIHVYCASNNGVINSNTIDYEGATTSNKIGIQVGKNCAGATQMTINGNTIEGCASSDIEVYYTGTDMSADITNNVLQYDRLDVGLAGNLSVTASGNIDFFNKEVPLTWLTSGD